MLDYGDSNRPVPEDGDDETTQAFSKNVAREGEDQQDQAQGREQEGHGREQDDGQQYRLLWTDSLQAAEAMVRTDCLSSQEPLHDGRDKDRHYDPAPRSGPDQPATQESDRPPPQAVVRVQSPLLNLTTKSGSSTLHLGELSPREVTKRLFLHTSSDDSDDN